ncbi:LytTR family two component transcriptional regulator [Aquimarina sp. MAR_2010_214]|uniref:LytR/AlgR family response regulator transcription factor n=1 Tax=Aquimarina sp. MAR_2010_214 TaxID=1250026 RepID=UPI000C710356|nr:LytTR family DNA-binding domain-containing protein [Aquimarina sp. MAR_2010_214]PKV51456.1 LytTR family two component transcriptional regulator [Aquimarina sp. MAR_2010_214]
MQVLIIEDESRAANQLQNVLKTGGFEYQLLDIIDTVEDAVIWFQTHPTPDLVFMDIQLADGLSFEIFQEVNVEAPIVFTTAFDQYAIQAFKVNSIDYLLKPIQQDELNTALNKFFKTNEPSVVAPDILKQLLSSMQVMNHREGILVKEGSGFVQIKTSDLIYVYSQESITFGVAINKRYIIDETIDQLFSSLDPNQFYRINRGQIISKISIQKIDSYFNHRVKLSMLNPRDQEFIVSRQKTSDFKEWMNK